MKYIYIQYKRKIVFYFTIILFANISIAKEESSTYFERTAAYYRIQKEVMNPFYEGISNLSLISPNIIQNYYSINPKNILNKLKRETTLGLNEKTFIITEQYDNQDIIMPSVVSVNFYIENRMTAENKDSFRDEMKNNFTQSDSKISNNNKAINIINKNIGSTNIMVDIKGSLEINGELEFVDQEGGNLQQGDNWNLEINQKQRFDLNGKIGDRFRVSADQNSESDFDWENALLVQYDGYENEVIKKISAGNISLQLPHTQLVSVGMGKREGLFGIKMESNFGNLSLNTIIGREKVKKESFPLSDQGSGISRYDYEFLKDKYFYIDKVFKLFHYPHSEYHQKNNHIRNDYGIVNGEFEVFKKSQTSNICSDCYDADAYLDPSNPDNSFKQSGRWERLEGESLNGNEYTYDAETGILRLNTVSSSDAIAIHYVIGQKNNQGGYDFVNEEYNKTYTNVDAMNTEGDECINNVNNCDVDDLSTLAVCEESIDSYGYCLDWEDDDILPEFTQYSDCVSQKWIEGACFAYNPANGLFDIETAATYEIICEGINDFDWVYTCDYLNNDENVGYAPHKLILKLIKTLGQQTYSSETWDLMLKNVYSLGTSNINVTDPPIVQIIHVGGQLGTETASSTGKTYLNIFGLDNLDSAGDLIQGGDGKIDIASGQSGGVINSYGDIFFPFHMPFTYDEGEALENININGVSEGVYWGNTDVALEDVFDDDLSGENTDNFPCINTIENPSGCLDIPGYYEYVSGPDMYFSSNDNPQKEFKITVKNINQNTTINLDFMIVEGSETLTDGNEVLIKNIDYRIDYNSGTLTLISDRAKNSAETLTVSYDRHEIVSFDQKLILGNYFKYDFSENSNIFGGAYMYTQEIAQKKVDIGYEPMENFMWHIGGNYSHEFETLNEKINTNTSINLDKASKLEILTEYAEINPNPNPLGVAYIDNFEGSSEGYIVSENFSIWKPSSPSLYEYEGTIYKNSLVDRYKMMWYNPFGEDDINTEDIWDVNVENNSKESTLWIEIPEVLSCPNPLPTNLNDFENYYNCYVENENMNNDTWWSGITTYITDHEHLDKKYLDIWLNTSGAGSSYDEFDAGLDPSNNMKLHIDIGEISEDINLSGGAYPNQEDSPMLDEEFGGNGVYDESEDVGIDSCLDADEDGWGGCLCVKYDHYGTQNNHDSDNPNPYYRCKEWLNDDEYDFQSYQDYYISEPQSSNDIINILANPVDPNGDNWSFNENANDFDWFNYNGTENNSNQSTYKINNTEDFDADNSLDLINSYFTYEIDLSRAHEFTNTPNPNSDIIVGYGKSGWTLYRIPLNSFDSIKENDDFSNPDWNDVHHFRIRISGQGNNNNFGQIGIASIELVGNQWKNLGVVSNDYSFNAVDNEDDYTSNDNIIIEVVNTYQNENYVPPPDVVVNTTQSTIDNTEYEEMEQSLVISFEECESICNEMETDIDCEFTTGCIWNNNSCILGEECGIQANSSAFIKKIFPYSGYDSQRQNSFFAYKNMEMYYKAINKSNYGFDSDDWEGNVCIADDDVEMVFRFGKDDNYYEITQILDNNCEGNNCNDAWNNLNINLEELTYFKKNRNTTYEDNLDVGVDGCINSYETGYFVEHNNLIIPQCFDPAWIDNGETFSNLCSSYLTTNNCDDDNSSDECEAIDLKINTAFCTIDTNEEIYYYDSELGYKYYRPNKNDPSGDDFQIPYEDCCILEDDNCTIDKICSSIPRVGIDCIDIDPSQDDICTDLPQCPDQDLLHKSLTDYMFYAPENLGDDPDPITYSSSFKFHFLGTEDNYYYDCYFYDNSEWEECPELSTFNEASPPDTYNDDHDNFSIIGEINNNVPYFVSTASTQEHDIWIWNSEDNPEIENVCNECTSVSIKGEPAINRIEYVIVGVKNDTSEDIYGSMWINELRMSGVKKEKGSAFLANLKFNLGELFNVNLSYLQQEANFHKIEKRLSSGSNKINYSATIGFNPHEFLKEKYFEMPFNLKYTSNVSSPLYKTGSDVFLGTSINDAAEDEKTKSNKLNFSTSIKTNLSEYFNDNLFLLYFLDKAKINYTYSKDNSSSPIIENKIAISKKLDYSYNLVYNKNNYWQPFKNIFEKDSKKYDDESIFVKILKAFKVYYSPKDMQFTASYTDNNTSTLQREIMGGTEIKEENINLYRSFKTSYSLSDNFLINYNIDMRNNLNEYNNDKLFDISKLFDLNFAPGIKKSNSEKFTFTYNPQVLDWLSPRFTYSPRYTWTRDIGASDDITADIKSENDFSASFSLSFQKLIEKFYKSESTTTSSRSRSSRNRKTNSNEKSKALYIDQPHFKTILKFFHDLSKKVSSISVNYKYSTKNNYNNILEDFIPSYSFKLGFKDNPFGNLDINEYTSSTIGGYSFTKNFYQELKFNTTLQITNNLSVSNLEYKISFSANDQSTTGYNETKAYSYFPMGDRGNDGLPIFNWSINFRGIEKISFLKNWFKTITFNHNYSGEKSETLQGEETQKIDYRRSFSPLIGIKLVPKNWPLNINLNFNNTLNIENTGLSTERKTSEQINITFDYKRDGGIQIPIFFLRDFEIENNIDLKLTLGYDKSQTDYSSSTVANFETTAFSNSFNIKPEITYSFSKYIDGNFYVNYSVSETHTTGTKETTDIGFKVKIVFESFK